MAIYKETYTFSHVLSPLIPIKLSIHSKDGVSTRELVARHFSGTPVFSFSSCVICTLTHDMKQQSS